MNDKKQMAERLIEVKKIVKYLAKELETVVDMSDVDVASVVRKFQKSADASLSNITYQVSNMNMED